MNELFVNIKVDREERPDIDQIYMNALHLLGEQGGWPLTMFLTPAGRAGMGRHVFSERIALRPPGLRRRAARSGAAVSRGAQTGSSRTAPRCWRGSPRQRAAGGQGDDRAERARRRRACSSATCSIRSMAACAARRNFRSPPCSKCCGAPGCAPSDARFFETVEHHARTHERGRHLRSSRRRLLALFGRRADGWCRISRRCSTTTRSCSNCWRSPGSAAASRCFAQRARETVGWLDARDDHAEGAFCASLDADSEGEEGKFYVWSLRRDRSSCSAPEAGEFFAAALRRHATTAISKATIFSIASTRARAQRGRRSAAGAVARESCWSARDGRVRPGLDDKVLADWNGLMIARSGQCRRSFSMSRLGSRWRKRAFDFIAAIMTQGRPARSFLARRAVAVSRPRLRFRRHDPRRARAVMRRPASALSRACARLAERVRCALRRRRHRRLLSVRRRRIRSVAAAAFDAATMPRPIRMRLPRKIWCGWRRLPATTNGATKADRLIETFSPPPSAICSAMSRCSTHSICGCGAPRSW